MPRPRRADAPGAVHHVMFRGVDGREIFACGADREDFLSRFALLVHELEFLTLGWCLLGNHAHLVLKTGAAPLAMLMARLNSRHAQRFNRRSARVGHLFQDRYKAVAIDSDGQLAVTLAYVAGNPVRHGMCSLAALRAYPWSSYGALMGDRRPREFERMDEISQALGVGGRSITPLVADAALEPGAVGAALEPDQIAELDLLIRDCCRRHGVRAEALRDDAESARAARREILAIASRRLDVATSEIARRVRIPYATALRIRRRSRAG